MKSLLTGSDPGSTGNIVTALAAFFIAGLGRSFQERPLRALVQFANSPLWLGWIIHIWPIIIDPATECANSWLPDQ